MGKSISSIILACIITFASLPPLLLLAAPGDAIAFPDPNFEAAVRKAISKPTGAIAKGDVDSILELDVNGSDITDLTGIEYFTCLTRLNCSANQLDTLDLSKNTALIELVCYKSQIASLNISTFCGSPGAKKPLMSQS